MEVREKQRVRLNVSRTSKGAYAWEATLEVEESNINNEIREWWQTRLQTEMDEWHEKLDAMFPPTP